MKIAATRWITFLIILGLLGVLSIQGIWINRALHINARAMDRAVAQALAKTSERLETLEDAQFIREQSLDSTQDLQIIELKEEGSHEALSSRRPLSLVRKFSSINVDPSLKQSIKIRIDSLKTEVRTIAIEDGSVDSLEHTEELLLTTLDKNAESMEQRLIQIELKQERIGKLIDKMAYTMSIQSASWRDFIDDSTLAFILAEEFDIRDLPGDFEYALWNGKDTGEAIISSDGFDKDISGKVYSSPILTGSLISSPGVLEVAFPKRTSHIMKSMLPLILISMIFAVLLTVAASAGIITMFRQKKINRVKSDFINNISHEFKTPIASIGLASDSIENEQVLSNPDSIKNYVRIIKEENKRMQDQVDKVLQMALIDRHELNLSLEELDIIPLAEKAVDAMLIQAKSRNGAISFHPNSEGIYCKLDRVHFFNALSNLIDNAIKYSEEAPEVHIRVWRDEAWARIDIRDNGIGMDKATQLKVFDRFYRHSMGNIHNVKGFGLGLSYVEEVITAMDGHIALESKEGEGSCFSLFFPVIDKMVTDGKA